MAPPTLLGYPYLDLTQGEPCISWAAHKQVSTSPIDDHFKWGVLWHADLMCHFRIGHVAVKVVPQVDIGIIQFIRAAVIAIVQLDLRHHSLSA